MASMSYKKDPVGGLDGGRRDKLRERGEAGAGADVKEELVLGSAAPDTGFCALG